MYSPTLHCAGRNLRRGRHGKDTKLLRLAARFTQNIFGNLRKWKRKGMLFLPDSITIEKQIKLIWSAIQVDLLNESSTCGNQIQ